MALGVGTRKSLAAPARGSLPGSPLGQALPDSLDPGWSSGHSGRTPAHALGVDTARSGVTRHLHGCSLTWFEPMSAAGFASVQLSWFCFAAVIVFDSNAAQHKEVVASFLSSQHQGWLSKATFHLAPITTLHCKNCLPCPPSSFSVPQQILAPWLPTAKLPCAPQGGSSSPNTPPWLPSANVQDHAPRVVLSALWTTESSNSINLIRIGRGPEVSLLLS